MRYAKSPQTQVSTSPEENLSAFIAQRMRWASKNSALPSRTIQFLWGFIWLVNVAFVALVALTIAAQVSWGVAICALLVKLLVEGFALNSVASYFKLDKLMRWFPIAFGLNIIYVFVIGILAMLKPTFEWKGRKLNK